MGLISRLENQGSLRQVRNYIGAKTDNSTVNWLTSSKTADEILRWQLPKLRDRSRDLARNNDYVKAFLRLLKTNVIGPNGINLQSKVKNGRGKLDTNANARIEEGWERWGKKKNASVCGTLSWRQMQALIIESVARDGEVLIRKVKGFDNEFKYALQMIEPDHLDCNLNKVLPNGNSIRMGIEFDAWKRRVAYHLLAKHPGDNTSYYDGQHYMRVPADEMIHYFIRERESQTRGVPWIHTAIIRLHMLGAYEEAALIAARIGASKMGFYVSQDGAAEYIGDAKDDQGNIVNEAEPGQFEKLPLGYDFKTFDPAYPNGEMEKFLKAMLRGASAGMGPLYNNLAHDLEGVNFSSIRQGTLSERDYYKFIQVDFSESVCQDVYDGWLPMALLTQQVNLSIERLDKFNAARWQARGWDWVDPTKDINAKVEALNNRLTSRTRILSELGVDIEDLLDEIEQEEQMMKDRGISLSLGIPKKEVADAKSDTEDDQEQAVKEDS